MRTRIYWLPLLLLLSMSPAQADTGFNRTLDITPPAYNSFTPEWPDMELINQEGEVINIRNLFSDDNNILFAFFFTQCITICTTTTFNMKSVEGRLPKDTILALISIDPDNDTPDALQRYAQAHQLTSTSWQLLTGNRKDLERFQRSLESFRGNKMNHKTSLFLKKSGERLVTEIPSHFEVIPKLFKPQ